MEPLTLAWIHAKVKSEEYLFSLHADEERRSDALEIVECEEALLNGTILEEYPEDPRGASCLVHGRAGNKDIHLVCGRNRSDWLVLITVYVPLPPKWVTPQTRRPSR